MIHHGDCLDVMAAMEPESVDAIVTDPPYGIGFMGKAWDGADIQRRARARRPRDEERVYIRKDTGKPYSKASTYAGEVEQAGQYDHSIKAHLAFQEFSQTWAEAAYRVAKPSAYLLAFGGTRTVHRMTVALEDAGWIIRDMLVWGYASGFPKSKASLKPAWEPIVMARKPGPLRMLAIDECRIPSELEDGREVTFRSLAPGATVNKTGDWKKDEMVTKAYPSGRWPANIVLTDPIFDGGIEGVVGGGETTTHPGTYGIDSSRNDFAPGRPIGTTVSSGDSGTYSRFFLIPKADRADREPVLGGLPERRGNVGIQAAEPGTYQERVQDPDPDDIAAYLRENRERMGLSKLEMDRRLGTNTMYSWFEGRLGGTQLPTPEMWRRIKVILGFDDRYDEVMTTTHEVNKSLMNGARPHTRPDYRYDPAPRANVHPTVKPTDLMRHLVRLVTPTGGTVLDCFAGSGSTLIAAEQEGFAWIGIEREAEYVAIAEARLNGTQRGLGLEAI